MDNESCNSTEKDDVMAQEKLSQTEIGIRLMHKNRQIIPGIR